MKKPSPPHRPALRSTPAPARGPRKPPPLERRAIVLYKPYDVLSQFTAEDSGQRTLAEFGLPPDVSVAGRLDRDSEGLLFLTNDGPLIKRLLDPEHGHPRTYLAQVEGIPTPEALTALQAGVDIRVGKDMYRTRPCQAELLAEDPDLPARTPPIRYRAAIPTRWLRLTLCEGKNRQVRKMTAAVGFPTLRLVRVQMADLSLDGLAPGEWRIVTPPVLKRTR